jgi:hypothetical protein
MFNFLFKKEECFHDKITPDIDSGYCPDCGDYVENQWFMSRCACCGLKQKTIILKGEISTSTNFCKNCGTNSFMVERINKINFIDINYAIVIKSVSSNKKTTFTQSWVEPKEQHQLRLLTHKL